MGTWRPVPDGEIVRLGYTWYEADIDDVEPFLDTAFAPAFGNGTIDPPYTTTRPPSHQWIERADIGEMFVRRERVEQALTQATWLLNTLTGGKLHGVECWQENYDVHSCEIKLRRGPVINIHRVQKVKQCGRWIERQTEVEDFCIVRPGVISFCCNCSYSQWSCGCTNTVRVDYQIDSNLPPGTASTVAWLAAEYMKAFDGKACALPDRISNVTRQGVSWTILDPQDSSEKGRTGISRVDQWLETAKRKPGRASLIDPLRSDRLTSQRMECDGAEFGPDCGDEPFNTDFAAGFSFGDGTVGCPTRSLTPSTAKEHHDRKA